MDSNNGDAGDVTHGLHVAAILEVLSLWTTLAVVSCLSV